VEAGSPGTKAAFYLGYVDRIAEALPGGPRPGPVAVRAMRAAHHGPVLRFLPSPGADPGGTTGSSEDDQVAREIAEEVLPVEAYAGHGGKH